MSTKDRQYFLFYRRFWETLLKLPDKDRLRLYDVIGEFGFTHQVPPLDGVLDLLFPLMQTALEKDWTRYTNGSKGGRPTETEPNENRTETETEPNENRTETETEPNENRTETEQGGGLLSYKQITDNREQRTEDEKQNTEDRDAETSFSSFWDAYPKKEREAEARKAFDALLKKGEDETVLIAAATEYARHCRKDRTEKRYIFFPVNFLRDERYKDFVKEPPREWSGTNPYKEFELEILTDETQQ